MYGSGMPTKDDLVRRAHAAWLKYTNGPEPTTSASTVEQYEGRTYVVLRRGGQVLAIYRYKPAGKGQLVLMRRGPNVAWGTRQHAAA